MTSQANATSCVPGAPRVDQRDVLKTGRGRDLVDVAVVCLPAPVAPPPWLMSLLGFSLLEVVNYLEHYGLLRQKKEDGRYERCLPEHSWNSNNVASNVLLYHLQRHSDHHANPTRRYQALRDFEESPGLPTGYAGMIVLAVMVVLLATGAVPVAVRRVAEQEGAAVARFQHGHCRSDDCLRVLARVGLRQRLRHVQQRLALVIVGAGPAAHLGLGEAQRRLEAFLR